MMLQAQIEIMDEMGRAEDSVTIVGSGQVSLGMRDGSFSSTVQRCSSVEQ